MTHDFVIQKIQASIKRVNTSGFGEVWHTVEELYPTETFFSPQEYLENFGKKSHNFILPGFIDSHLHMLGLGKMENELDLGQFSRLEQAIRFVNEYASQNPESKFIVGRDWDESKFQISRSDLEKYFESHISEKIPVILKRHCRHSALVNRKMRHLAKDQNSAALIGDASLGHYLEVTENHDSLVSERYFLNAQSKLLKNGIVGVSDMSQDEHSVSIVRQLAEKGLLEIDVAGVFDWGKTPSLEGSGPSQYISNRDSLFLNRKPVYNAFWAKKYLDGSLGASTALLSQNYSDELSNPGQRYMTNDDVVHFSREALQRGFKLCFHAIGDGAIDQIVYLTEVLGDLFKAKHKGVRNRIEHAQVLRDDQVEFFRKNDFWDFHLQPIHRVTDLSFSDSRLGEERLFRDGYRAGTLRKNSLSFCLGSDATIDKADPLLAIMNASEHPNPAEQLNVLYGLWHSSLLSMSRLGFPIGKLSIGQHVVALECRASDNKLAFL